MLAALAASLALLAVDDALERIRVQDAQMALAHLDDVVVRELGEGAAHRLQLQAQVAADFLARHAQHQFGLGKAPRMQALHQVEHEGDRKSTRLNSSHSQISYAVFCLKKQTTSSNQ